MQSIVEVNPFRCRMWTLHDRLDSHLTEETCKAEIDSFCRHGQLIPVLGRILRGDPSYDVELVYGARRLFVARHLNKPLKVQLREMSDKDAIIAMDIENRQRKDISPYERGLSYAQWLRSGYFESQDDISRALKVSSSQVSRLLKLARLPSVIVAAFTSPSEICEGWGLDIIEALEDPVRRQSTVDAARALTKASPRYSSRDVYRQLLAASARGRKLKVRSHDEVVKDANGSPLFRIRQQSSSIALVVPLEKVSQTTLEVIRRSLAGILQHTSPQTVDLASLTHQSPETKPSTDGPMQNGVHRSVGLRKQDERMDAESARILPLT